MATRHPEATIDVIGYSLLDDGMLVDIRVRTNDFPAWVEELRAFPDVYDVRMLGRAHNATTARVFYNGNEIFSDICRLHLILRVPFTIRDGVADVVMAGPDGSIRRFVNMFPKLNAQVEAVYDAEREKESLLTRRQAYVFRCAWAAGYFEVPRHVTLTELAGRMGVAVSSLSEILAVIERKLLQESQSSVQ
jgi:predicted DNA binding protein